MTKAIYKHKILIQFTNEDVSCTWVVPESNVRGVLLQNFSWYFFLQYYTEQNKFHIRWNGITETVCVLEPDRLGLKSWLCLLLAGNSCNLP